MGDSMLLRDILNYINFEFQDYILLEDYMKRTSDCAYSIEDIPEKYLNYKIKNILGYSSGIQQFNVLWILLEENEDE